jgi:hypothetical protein
MARRGVSTIAHSKFGTIGECGTHIYVLALQVARVAVQIAVVRTAVIAA